MTESPLGRLIAAFDVAPAGGDGTTYVAGAGDGAGRNVVDGSQILAQPMVAASNAYADYLAAEAECRGELVNRAGVRAGVRDGFALWCGPRRIAEKYATEELLEFWLTHQRVTVSEYAAQRAAGLRAARLEARRIPALRAG